MHPRYPVFIPTKGRWKTRHTIKMFEKMGVTYTAFVEPQEYDNYAQAVNPENIHVLPHSNEGLVVTRNYIWDYAESLGTSRFWTFDDNILYISRLHKNRKLKVMTGAPLAAIEDFADRYQNMAIAGMQYFMFARQKAKHEPISFNTRVYSNMLIQTDIPYRNRGFYNDDTDLCLQVLSDGWCTALFNAFLIRKLRTMTVKGGMTPHYQGDGRYKMARELQERWPTLVKITRKWGRWQHHVDYRPFKRNQPILRDDIEIPDEPNNYGMKLVKVEN